MAASQARSIQHPSGVSRHLTTAFEPCVKPHRGGQAEQVRAWWMPGCNLRSKSHWGCSSRGKTHAAGMPEHPWERAHHQNPGKALHSCQRCPQTHFRLCTKQDCGFLGQGTGRRLLIAGVGGHLHASPFSRAFAMTGGPIHHRWDRLI